MGGFVVNRHAGVVVVDHAANEPGNRRKQLLQVAVCNQRVVHLQQHVQSFFFLHQGLAGQGILHRHGDQFRHPRQKAHVSFAVGIGLGTAQARACPNASARWSRAASSRTVDLWRAESPGPEGIAGPPPDRVRPAVAGFARPIPRVIPRPALPTEPGQAHCPPRSAGASHFLWDRKGRSGLRLPSPTWRSRSASATNSSGRLWW